MTPEEAVAAPQTTGATEMDEVMARMRELATHRGDDTRRSKRDRSALKTTFRDLISSVEVTIYGTYSTAPLYSALVDSCHDCALSCTL